LAFSKYNDRPGSGYTGFARIAPNGGYDFYEEEDKYAPNVRGDPTNGGVSTEWTPGYEPTREEYLRDKAEAEAAGVPLGSMLAQKHAKNVETQRMTLTVRSLLHTDAEYGGPFEIEVTPYTRVAEVKKIIANKCGVLPGLQKLTYAGRDLDDPNRTLGQMGCRYWHAKFPRWPLTIVRST
jgi:hypothetical protein